MRKLMIAAILLVLALAALDLTYEAGPEPDVICPMSNQHIVWYYAGK